MNPIAGSPNVQPVPGLVLHRVHGITANDDVVVAESFGGLRHQLGVGYSDEVHLTYYTLQ